MEGNKKKKNHLAIQFGVSALPAFVVSYYCYSLLPIIITTTGGRAVYTASGPFIFFPLFFVFSSAGTVLCCCSNNGLEMG